MTTISRGSGKSPYSDKTLLENNDLKKKYETRYHELRGKFREIHSQQRFDNAKVSLLQLATASATAILPHFLCLKHSYSDYWGLYQNSSLNSDPLVQTAPSTELELRAELVDFSFYSLLGFVATSALGLIGHYWVNSRAKNEVNNLLNSKEKKEFNELLEKKNKLIPKEPSKACAK